MKQTRMLFFAALATSSLCAEPECLLESQAKCSQCRPNKESKSEETGKVVIANFLNMFANFLRMVTAEKGDKETLINGGMGIAGSLAAIATQACKCVELTETSPEELLTYITTQCAQANVDEELTQQLTRAIKLQYWRSALLAPETRARYAEYAVHSGTSND